MLVITVIVILILSTVAINYAFQPGGILTMTQKETEDLKAESDKKAISEAIAVIYMENKGKDISFADLPNPLHGSNTKNYEIDYLNFTIGGFTFAELDLDFTLEESAKFCFLGDQDSDEYYLWSRTESDPVIVFYQKGKDPKYLELQTVPNSRNYYNESNGYTFEFKDDVLFLYTESGAKRLYAISQKNNFTSLAGKQYTGTTGTCSFTDDTITLTENGQTMTGKYAAYVPNPEFTYKEIYTSLFDSDTLDWMSGTEVYDSIESKGGIYGNVLTLNNKKYYSSILDKSSSRHD